MNDNFEYFVEHINWCKLTDTDDVKLDLMTNFAREKVEAAEKYARELVNKLYHVYRAWQNEDSENDMGIWSSDGLHDLICHVVGQGEAEVNKVIDDISLLGKRWENGDYVENFLYVFPYEDDYEKLDLDYYIKSAVEIEQAVEDAKERGKELNLMDIADILDVCDEFKKGIFSDEYDYDTLWQLGRIISQEAYIANVWSDGRKFYKSS